MPSVDSTSVLITYSAVKLTTVTYKKSLTYELIQQ